MPASDPVETLTKALESARNIRLGKGVTSKTSYIAALPLVVLGMVAWRWSEDIVMNTGLLFIALAAIGFAVWFISSSRTFAERNPALALLEGAELIEWRRMEVEAKGVPSTEKTISIEDKGGMPPTLPEAEV